MSPNDATLKPTGSLSAQLQAVRGGDLVFTDAPRSDLAAELTPFFKGDKPAHTWSGTSLAFERPDGSFDSLVDLKGAPGDNGTNGLTEAEIAVLAANTANARAALVAQQVADQELAIYEANHTVVDGGNF